MLEGRQSLATSNVLDGLFADDRTHDTHGVAIPRPEIHIVVRFGSVAHGGLDAHAMGVRDHVHRKVIRRGQRTVMARLRLGTHEAVLGVPASAIVGRAIPLEDLWGDAVCRRLFDRLARARDATEAALTLERVIAERAASTPHESDHTQLARAAAERLARSPVSNVAEDLGVSERHLRRVFRESFGIGPKTFAKLRRFQHAIEAAQTGRDGGWAGVALSAGYYDQAHLIGEFRTIAGTTPRALLVELSRARSQALEEREERATTCLRVNLHESPIRVA